MAITAGSRGGLEIWRPGPTFTEATDVAFALVERGPDVVVDLTGFSPHDTADLGALVDGVRQFHAEGGRPIVMCPAPGTRLLLRSTGIDRAVPVVPDMATVRLHAPDQ